MLTVAKCDLFSACKFFWLAYSKDYYRIRDMDHSIIQFASIVSVLLFVCPAVPCELTLYCIFVVLTHYLSYYCPFSFMRIDSIQ